VRTGGDAKVWVAFGLSATWETPLACYVDDARVTID
jgi:hypothetical protein